MPASLFYPHRSESEHPHRSAVWHSHLSSVCLNHFIRDCRLQLRPDFLFLSPFHYLVNIWLGQKSETDLWAYLSAHSDASWHTAPYYLPPQGGVILGGTTCLLEWLSITTATGIQWRANRKLSLVLLLWTNQTTPCFHLHLISEPFTDLTIINNEHRRVHTCPDPSPPSSALSSATAIDRLKTKNVLGKFFWSTLREQSQHSEQCTGTSCIKYLLRQPRADLSCMVF